VHWAILEGRELQQGWPTVTRNGATLLLKTRLRAALVYTYINIYIAKCGEGELNYLGHRYVQTN